jgi:hypothetical protein
LHLNSMFVTNDEPIMITLLLIEFIVYIKVYILCCVV